jgi:HD-GYP domain-containing protein (c-di-GMP phosphodiesterase class II)
VPFSENPSKPHLTPFITPPGPPARDPLDLLERFAQDVQDYEDPNHQIHLLLRAVREATRADVAFLSPQTSHGPADVVGKFPLPARWCRDLVQQLLGEAPGTESQLLRNDLQGAPAATAGQPHSIAMVRLSRSRSRWLAVLSFKKDRSFQIGDIRVMNLARRILLNRLQQSRLYERHKETVVGLIHGFTTAIDAKDHYTFGHSERVARIAVRLGQEMRLPRAFRSDLYLAGLLHDIGMIGVRDEVLVKPGELTFEEMEQIKEHTVVGERIIASIKQLAHLCAGVRGHHERYDGCGYPDGLMGTDVPLLARVLAVADAFDAMSFDRPYRKGMPPSRLEAVLADGAGKQWDPLVVEALLACRHELYSICQKGLGNSTYVAVDDVIQANPQASACGTLL